MMKKRFFDNGFLVLLALLVCTDIVFIGLHLVHTYTPLLPNHVYSIEQDKGHAEFFQYTKQFWIILLLTLTFIKEASLTNFSWLMVFCYVLLDDALSIHENLGLLSSNLWTFAARMGLRPQDWGELLVTGAVGVVLLTPVAIAFLRASTRERRHTLILAALLGLLAFFGVFIDMVHIWFGGEQWGLVEDGGEMLVVSMVLYYVFRHQFGYASAALPQAGNAENVRKDADLQPLARGRLA